VTESAAIVTPDLAVLDVMLPDGNGFSLIEKMNVCPVNADKALIKRAVSNLIKNSMNHNEQGCTILVLVS
jgi:response regulator of citrate/malate metabolism